ncbi:MAG TPA: hypothetical protein VMB51_04595 [Solirubrobacteraceae bacterium]|nr:hypothetical protein [Solirubrobacteraceae bacterium]
MMGTAIDKRMAIVTPLRRLTLLTLLALGLTCAPAAALSQRGHRPGFSFAGRGSSADKLSHPAGIAVNEANGDVYVVDAANNRVERFSQTGEFISTWGWGVSDGKSEFEICTSGCQAGVVGEAEGQFDAPEAIAVDNSSNPHDPSRGDIYVLSDTASQNYAIQKFSATGAPLGRLRFTNEDTGTIGGVAVDAEGQLWVSDLSNSELLSFDDALANEQSSALNLTLACAETPGLAVNAGASAFYLSHQLEDPEEECPEKAPSAKTPALIARLNAGGEVQSEALGELNSSAVAVDQASEAGSPLGARAAGDVYVDNQTSIAAYDSSGALIQRFGSEAQLSAGSGVAIDSRTGDVYVADAKGDDVAVFSPEGTGGPSVDEASFEDITPTSTRLKAQIDPHGLDTDFYFQYGTADCRATPASCISVPAPPGEDLGAGYSSVAASAMAEGLQAGTTYFYRVIASNEAGKAEGEQSFGSFTTLPSAAGTLADGRAWELVSPPEKHGALIYPIGGTTEGAAPGSGAIQAAEAGGAITYAANAPIGEGVAGDRAPEATQALSVRTSEGWSTQDIVTPHEHSEGIVPTNLPQEYRAFSGDLSLGLVQPFGGFGNRYAEPPLVAGAQSEERGIYLRNDSDPGCLQASLAGCFQALLDSADVSSGAQFGGEVEVLGASPDLQHVVFSSGVALSSTPPSASGLYEYNAGESGAGALQLISILPGNSVAAEEPEPQLGDLDPGVSSARDAVSDDGSRVFWSAQIEGRSATVTRLFMRDTTQQETIQINAAQGLREPSGEEAEKEEVHFRSASADGSRVFFTDNFPLTTSSRLRREEGGPADLYVCEVLQGARGPECKLTDLTVQQRPETQESADVVGTVLGNSEDGSYVYFVANGVLSDAARAEGATPGDCARPSARSAAQADARCNLYLARFDSQSGQWQTPRFIASLSQQDSPDWGSSGGLSLASLTARVSPNGRYLAFMSRESLTGYDNRDQSTEAQGARDEEVYVYDAQQARLVCVSCNPQGEPPHGVLDREATGEGKGLLVDRFGVWQETQAEEQGAPPRALDHWLAGSIPGWTPLDPYQALYQSRYLTNQGRLFFDSPDELVPAAHNGRQDVYEYEPQGIGSCGSAPGCVSLISSGNSDHESAFLDASASGEDVFFLTSQALVAGDHDSSYDVYDAHVCSAQAPCTEGANGPQEPCASLASCQASYTSPQVPAFSPAGTATASGQGNLVAPPAGPGAAVKAVHAKKPPTRAQLLASALRACKRSHRHARKKRVACERRARKRYGPKKRTRKPGHVGGGRS